MTDSTRWRRGFDIGVALVAIWPISMFVTIGYVLGEDYDSLLAAILATIGLIPLSLLAGLWARMILTALS